MSDIVWTTKDGRKLKLEDIDNRHLLNIIRFLKHKKLDALSAGYSAMSCYRGDHAIDAVASAIDVEQEAYLDAIAFFENAASNRGVRREVGDSGE